MAVEALQCKECETTYPLDARYVCENCFGPLEVAYDFSDIDAAEATSCRSRARRRPACPSG